MTSLPLICTEVTQHFKGKREAVGGRWAGFSRVREVKNCKSQGAKMGLCDSNMVLLTIAYRGRHLSSHGDWETGALASDIDWKKW